MTVWISHEICFEVGRSLHRERSIDTDLEKFAMPKNQIQTITFIPSFAVLCLRPRLSAFPGRTSACGLLRRVPGPYRLLPFDH